jgi:hypothetical protein
VYAIIRQKVCYFGSYFIDIYNSTVGSTSVQFYVNYTVRLETIEGTVEIILLKLEYDIEVEGYI